jgi:hypothetical protein
MPENTPIPFALKAAGEKLRHAKKTEATNRGLLQHAEQELLKAIEHHNNNKSLLMSGEAAAAEGEGADLVRLRKEFIKSRDEIDFLSTRVEGVNQLFEAAQSNLELAEEAFRNAWVEYAGREATNITDEYNTAVRMLLKVIDRGMARAAALRTPAGDRIVYRLGRQQILALGPDDKIFYRHRTSWSEDEDAVRVHGQVIDLLRDLRGEKVTAATGT